MTDSHSFGSRILDLVRYPLMYYRNLFDFYHLQENARQVPYPSTSSHSEQVPFSVVLFCQGNTQYLRSFFDALGKQILMPSELILLLRDSVPNLDQLIGSMEQDLDFPVHLVSYDSISAGAARNKGFQKAAHDLIVFSDADCIPGSDWLSSLVNPLCGNPKIDICFGCTSSPQLSGWKDLIRNQLRNRIGLNSLQPGQPSLKTFALFKQTWARAGGFPENAPQSTELPLFWLRLNQLSLTYTLFQPVISDYPGNEPDNRNISQLYRQARAEGKLGLFAPGIWRQLVFLYVFGAIIVGGTLLMILFPAIYLLGLGAVLAGLFALLWIWSRRDVPEHDGDWKPNPLDSIKIGWARLVFLVGYLVGVTGRSQARRKLIDDEKTQLLGIIQSHPQSRKVIIYFPTHDWGFMFQRPPQIARHFAREGYLFFYGTKNETADAVATFEKVEENLYLFSVPPETFQVLEDPILYLGSAWFASLLPLYPNAIIIYDHYDSLKMSSGRIEDHLALLEKADLAVVSSKDLIAEAKTYRDEILFVPNAVDYEFVVGSRRQDKSSLPSDLIEIIDHNKPIIGFIGALADWCDYELMIEGAKANPQWKFLYIGSDYDGSVYKTELLDQSNVRWIGPKPYQELFQYLWEFDVATIPFKINEMTIAMNPVKLFEYFACQKPVVTTPLPECQQYPEVLIASNALEFSTQIQKALEQATHPEFQLRMDQLAKQNTWQARVKVILEQIERLNSSEGATN